MSHPLLSAEARSEILAAALPLLRAMDAITETSGTVLVRDSTLPVMDILVALDEEKGSEAAERMATQAGARHTTVTLVALELARQFLLHSLTKREYPH